MSLVKWVSVGHSCLQLHRPPVPSHKLECVALGMEISLTQKNIINDSVDGIQATELGDCDLSWLVS